MTKFTGIAYEPHPVSPERKAELRKQGLKILDAQFEPEGAVSADEDRGPIGTDSADQFSNAQLREAIEAATGQKPHHFTGRENLIEQFNALNAGNAE